MALAALAGLGAPLGNPALETIHVRRADRGETVRFDPARVEGNYRRAATALKETLSRFQSGTPALMPRRHDAGLPDPIRTVRRTWKPRQPLPEPLRGATIFVVTIDRTGRIQGLPQDPLRRRDVVLVSRAERLSDCAALGGVTLLTRELAERLGLQASRARCTVSPDGAAVEIIEGDVP